MRAFGLDISQFQLGYDPTVKQHDFIMIRAAYGTRKDERYDQHLESIQSVPIKMAYQYFRSAEDWKAQADKMLEITEGHDFDMLNLDFERTYNTPSMKFAREAKMWIDYIRQHSGKHSEVYSNPASVQEYMYQYGNYWLRDDPNYKLWVAQYPYRGWNDQLTNVLTGTWQPRLPAGITNWLFWQFSADKNQKGTENGIAKPIYKIGSPDVDLNVHNGTREDLFKYFKKSTTPSPTPTNPLLDELRNFTKEMDRKYASNSN